MKQHPDIEFAISSDQLCFIIIKAREFDVKEWPLGLESGSNASDDGMVEVLEARRSDPVFAELRGFIDALDEDRQIDLVALAWVGRGDFAIGEWTEARAEAATARETNTADYLLGMPLLSEFLEDALSDAGRSCAEEERLHL
jgi:hypothetical protein